MPATGCQFCYTDREKSDQTSWRTREETPACSWIPENVRA